MVFLLVHDVVDDPAGHLNADVEHEPQAHGGDIERQDVAHLQPVVPADVLLSLTAQRHHLPEVVTVADLRFAGQPVPQLLVVPFPSGVPDLEHRLVWPLPNLRDNAHQQRLGLGKAGIDKILGSQSRLPHQHTTRMLAYAAHRRESAGRARKPPEHRPYRLSRALTADGRRSRRYRAGDVPQLGVT